MRARKPRGSGTQRWIALTLCAPFAAAPPASAGDGVVELNAAAAAIGGITPGDAPGMPVTLSQSGSYRLTGSLTAFGPGDGIVVTTPGVSIDLNGFAVECLPFLGSQCTSGVGISAIGVSGVRVTNGTVRDFGGDGLLLGNEARVEAVAAIGNGARGIVTGRGSVVLGSQAASNGGDGISSSLGSVIRDCTARENGDDGIAADAGGTVIGNAASDNIDDGIIAVFGSTLVHNSAYSNGGDGFDLGVDSGFNNLSGGLAAGNTAVSNVGLGLRAEAVWGRSDNVLSSNNNGNANPQLSGGISLGASLCGAALCP